MQPLCYVTILGKSCYLHLLLRSITASENMEEKGLFCHIRYGHSYTRKCGVCLTCYLVSKNQYRQGHIVDLTDVTGSGMPQAVPLRVTI